MKKVNFTIKFTLLTISMVLTIIPIYSCSSDSDQMVVEPEGNENPQPEPPEEIKVRTLVADLGANDGLSLDMDGMLYASNFDSFMGTQVLRLDPESPTPEVAVDNLKAPTGNVVDNSGNTYVVHNVRRISAESDELIGDVVKIDSESNRTTLATLPGFPSGITLDDQGNLYVSNFAFPAVHKLTPEGEVNILVEDARLSGGVGIDFDDNGTLFVGNFETGDVLKINRDKSIEVLATLPTVQSRAVIGYITYLDGSIFATAVGEHVIYKIPMSGEATIFAGSGTKDTQDGSLLNSSFDVPNGIVGDAGRNVIYVTEAGGSLREIDLD